MTIDQAQRRKTIARWHRRVALIVGLWLLLLAISGIGVNHANDWGLDSLPLPGALQSWLYGMEPGAESSCGAAADPVKDCSTVFASIPVPEGTLLVRPHALSLLDSSGVLVETLPSATLGLGRIEAARSEGDLLYFRDGEQVVQTDSGLLEWQALSDADAAAIMAIEDWQSGADVTIGITWERLLLDLHAGRFLGSFAKGFTDLMAGLILLLAVTGGWLYLAKRNRNGNGSG